MSYAHLSYKSTLRSSQVISGSPSEEVPIGRIGSTALNSGVMLVFAVSSLSQGSCRVSCEGSPASIEDGGSYFNIGVDLEVNLSSNRDYFMPFSGAFPPYMRLQLTPSGGFDGQVEIIMRSAADIQVDGVS